MILKFSMVSFCAVLVAGCGVKKFECPYTDGVYCKSLSEVNEMVDRGEHGKRLCKKKSKAKENFMSSDQLALDKTMIMPIDAKEPIRVPETLVRIWLAPYESTDGTFHQQTYINTVVRQAHWAEGA